MTDDQDVLERNVAALLGPGDPPALDRAARARIRAHLIARHGRARSLARPIALGLAAAIAAALILGRFVAGSDRALAGAEVTAAPGARVTTLAPRHLRVEGAALIDVAPGGGPFVVDTAHGRIEVLGTRFVVDGAPDRTTTAVVRGEVRLATAGGALVLHAGEQGIAERGHPPVRSAAPRLSHLASWAQAARHRDEHAPAVHHGTLFARAPGAPAGSAEHPLPIVRLGVDVVVEDQVARVALDQTFHNASDDVLEGVYRFAVPPDAALQRFAMYVDGKLMESAVVERMAARRTYEELVYRRVDPALLEWAGAGRLALRVYPLPARQDKRLMLAYTQSLPRLYDDWTLAIPLPEVDGPVGVLDVSVRIKRCAGCELASPSHAIQVARDGDDAIVTYRAAAVTTGDTFVLRVRDPRSGVVATEASAAGERYLLVRAPGERAGEAAPYRPRTWVILDDVSASRDRLALRAQADVIDALLGELDEQDRVAVIAFDIAARTALPATRVLDVDRRAVRRALAGEGGVGATDLGAALDAALAALAGVAPDDARIIYLGDGAITSGPRNLDALRARVAGKAQVIAVGLGDGVDTQTLQALAAATGGYATTIDLSDDLAWRAFDLVAALHTARVTGVTARLLDGDGQPVAATSYAPAQLADGEELELIAKLGDATPAAVELTGTRAGAPWRRTIALPAARGPAGYLPRLWAQRHIAARLLAKHEPAEPALRELRDEAIRKEVVALGTRYFLLSRHTSLLVLENDAMYAHFGVHKGAGETWAPYAMPATIPLGTTAAPDAAPADGELVRDPTALIYRPMPYRVVTTPLDGDRAPDAEALGAPRGPGVSATEAELGSGPRLQLRPFEPAPVRAALKPESSIQDLPAPVGKNSQAQNNPFASDPAPVSKMPSPLRDRSLRGGRRRWYGQTPEMQLTLPSAPGFDDLTAFVPALAGDGVTRWRAALALGAPGPHVLEPAARALLDAARRGLPAGRYTWGERALAVDAARRIGWRRTTVAGLDETAALDGAIWTRRYAELGLDVTRAMPDDDFVVALAYLPVWIAEPAHYARWFDVTARGDREVVLGRAGRPVLVLRFDDQRRLVAVLGPTGVALVEVRWAAGPIGGRVLGDDVAVGFTPEAIADAPAWARGDAAAGVAVELPLRQPAEARARVPAAIATPAWRHAQRQLVASLAASHDDDGLRAAFAELRDHGGAAPGDLVLASATLATASALVDGTTPVARYLRAAPALRALASDPDGRPRGLAGVPDDVRGGLVHALWSLRVAAGAHLIDQPGMALDAALAVDAPARALRLIAASLFRGAIAARAWDAAVQGPYRNVASAAAAAALFAAGDYDSGVARTRRLIAELDLAALPIALDDLRGGVEILSGTAGWRVLWTAWRARVLAAPSYPHVLALLEAELRQSAEPEELTPVFDRAAALAAGDPARILELANLAVQHGDLARAEALARPLRATHPSRAAFQLLASIELAQHRPGEAFADLEAAQALGDATAELGVVRGELDQLITVARQVAVGATGAARDAAVARALDWGARWRASDPSNPAIDVQLADLLYAVDQPAAAWRQLSTAIERDPWSGAGYATAATALEAHGQVDAALALWQQAIVIEQTDPTPRFRAARALLALGRGAEAQAALDELLRQTWHSRWIGVVAQGRALRDAIH